MKNIYFLFIILFVKSIFSQEVLKDYWQSVQTFSTTSSIRDYNVSTIVDNKMVMVIDTFSGGPFNLSGLYTYDINSRALGNINFTPASGDRGIKCATSYKTGTPGLEYGIFGCYANSNTGASYPVIYTYNSQSGTVITDSLQEGSSSMYDGGIQKIIMYSPSTNHDTMRVFSKYNGGLSVFSKQINQTSFSPLSSLPVNIDYINACYIFNNILYIGGMYLDQPCLLESTDGRTFTPVAGFNAGFFPQYSCINNITSYNNQLYYSINMSGNDFYIYRYSIPNHFLVLSSGGFESVKSMSVFKNRLFVSTSKNDIMSILSNIYILDGPGNVDTSAKQFGYQDVDGNLLELISNGDSLYFVGNKGTFYPSRPSSGSPSSLLQLNDRYLDIWKLNAPTASFNYNNNLICMNASESFTSTSQNTDSLQWLYDGSYYSSSPGATAWMNYNFPTVGTHTVGLVAFGGTLRDTLFLSVNVYSVSATITGPLSLCQGDSLHLTSSVINNVGAVNYNWYNSGAAFGSNSPNINTLSIMGTSNYYLMATDLHGCSAISNTITTSVNPSIGMYGTISSASVGISGDLTLYKYQPVLTKFDSITTIPIGGFGSYTFPNLAAGDYILKAIPSASSLQTTYYGTNAISWKDATTITHGCISSSAIDINVIALTNIGTGPGQLIGTINQGNGFGHKLNGEFKPLAPGNPIGGIIVKGGKNPGGSIVAQTTTDGTGSYTLSSLPLNSGAPGDEYFILVDIPGLDTNGTYHVIITAGNTSLTNLNFTVDSMYINPLGTVTSINYSNVVLNNEISSFPNPTNQNVNLKYELTSSANVSIELYDVVGNKLKTILQFSPQEKNKYNQSIKLSDFESGIYFVKIKINSTEKCIKLIKNQ